MIYFVNFCDNFYCVKIIRKSHFQPFVRSASLNLRIPFMLLLEIYRHFYDNPQILNIWINVACFLKKDQQWIFSTAAKKLDIFGHILCINDNLFLGTVWQSIKITYCHLHQDLNKGYVNDTFLFLNVFFTENSIHFIL